MSKESVPNMFPSFLPNAYADSEGYEHQFGLAALQPNHMFKSNFVAATMTSIELPSPYVHPIFYVLVYSAIGLGVALISVAGNLVQLTGALRASRKLFKELLDNVVYATFRFHDTTPAGKIIYMMMFVSNIVKADC